MARGGQGHWAARSAASTSTRGRAWSGTPFGPGLSRGSTENRARPASGTAGRARLNLRSDECKVTESLWLVPLLGDMSCRGLFKSYSPSTAPLNRWACALNSPSVPDLAKTAAVWDGLLSAAGVTTMVGLGVLLGIGGRAPRRVGTMQRGLVHRCSLPVRGGYMYICTRPACLVTR